MLCICHIFSICLGMSNIVCVRRAFSLIANEFIRLGLSVHYPDIDSLKS